MQFNEINSRLGPARPNPRRVEAGRRNRELRRGLTEAGRERLRASILRRQPWRLSTGPKTAAGKQRAAQNGKIYQSGVLSVREVRALTRFLSADLTALGAARRGIVRQEKMQ